MIQTLKPSRTARIRMGNAHLEGISSGSAAVLTDSSAPEHVNKGAENATVPYFANMSDKRQKNLEDKMSFGNKNGGASAFWLACYIFLWISSSVIGTITNKKIMKVFPFPVSLSVIHIISGGLMDGFLLIQRQLPVFLNRDIMTGSIPVALCLAVGKILTYFSYGKIPVSLTHTVKSSSPIFSVLVSYFILGKVAHPSVLVSLVIITIGVTLSAVTEINFQFWGFLAALLASLTSVLHSAFMKRILNHFDADPFVIHYHTSVAAVALNLPFAIFVDGYRILSTSFISTETSPMNSLDLEGYSIPMVLFIISIGAQYISTIMSMFVLNNVSVISHQVSNTMKRLLVIVSSILYFRNPILASNALGIIFALAGFLSYGLTTLKTSNEKVTSAKFDKTFCGLLPNYSSFRQILTNAFPIKFPQSIYSVKPEDIESQSFVNESTGMSFSKSHNRFASRF